MIGRVWLRRLNPPPPPPPPAPRFLPTALDQGQTLERTDGQTDGRWSQSEAICHGRLTAPADESPLFPSFPKAHLALALVAALAITSSSICSNERVMQVSTVHLLVGSIA